MSFEKAKVDLLEQKSSLYKWYAGASADAPAYRNDRSPSQKEAAAQILRSSLLFYSSDESAKAQPAAQQEEEQHFTQHRQP